MNEKIQKAVEILKEGGVVIFPTDTAFGIGCRIDDEESIKRLFKIRKRPEFQATPVLVSSPEMAKSYISEFPQEVINRLVNHYWPGALTIVLKCKKEKVPKLVRGGGDSLGVRMPDSDIVLSMIEKVGVPLLGPSANFHGEKTPYSFEELDPKLVELADYVLEGECKLKKPSTVIDCTKKPWKILREGALRINI